MAYSSDELYYHVASPEDAWETPALLHEIPVSPADIHAVVIPRHSISGVPWARAQIVHLGFLMRRWRNNVTCMTQELNSWSAAHGLFFHSEGDVFHKVEEIYIIFHGADYHSITDMLFVAR